VLKPAKIPFSAEPVIRPVMSMGAAIRCVLPPGHCAAIPFTVVEYAFCVAVSSHFPALPVAFAANEKSSASVREVSGSGHVTNRAQAQLRTGEAWSRPFNRELRRGQRILRSW
jgi:hypothetical protein